MTESTTTTILVIDDDPSVHPLLDLQLGHVTDQVLHASTPQEGLQLAMSMRPDLILLDLAMPAMSGFDVCRELKEESATRDIPVVFLTGDNSPYHVARALDAGGDDYVVKPFNTVELQARVRACLRTKRLIDLLKSYARIDPLTGVGNRAAFERELAAAVSARLRQQTPFAILMVDVDYFKQINDTLGHGVGDEALRMVGELLRSACRDSDHAFRYGGDEFAVILRDVGYEGAMAVTHRIHTGIREIRIRPDDPDRRLTASIGIACADRHPDVFSGEGLLRLADQALYRAKQGGRDRIACASEPVAS